MLSSQEIANTIDKFKNGNSNANDNTYKLITFTYTRREMWKLTDVFKK